MEPVFSGKAAVLLPDHGDPRREAGPAVGPAPVTVTLTAPVVRLRALHPQIKIFSHEHASFLFEETLFMDLRLLGREGGGRRENGWKSHRFGSWLRTGCVAAGAVLRVGRSELPEGVSVLCALGFT